MINVMPNPLHDFLAASKTSRFTEVKFGGPDEALRLSARRGADNTIELSIDTSAPIPMKELSALRSEAMGFLLCILSEAQAVGTIPPARLSESGETILISPDGSELVVATDDDMIEIHGVASISPAFDSPQTVKFVSLMREALSKS